ncbi:hypothetical protein EHF33_04650 [Deinococcus psychrotolerans]|uniref:Uncharacterized protein n=1 Tax=Deinococcus psychrotolerans TaxID=2489213 RepID=A0A3G8YKQ0_9DEIO|nr:hypothetical protein [Deinococcus psychrotolerans]AZI42121.1 hypothetical protein EHF33_04650 [Deinococcus psychrotolerans]
MRKTSLGLVLLTALTSGPALAWVPKLEDQSAKTVIDSAYGRRATVPTFYTLDLSVDGGKFKAPDGSVKVYDGGDTCLSSWLANPTDFAQGSRVGSLTLSGQADQLLFAAQDARDNFKNMTSASALSSFGVGVLPDGTNDYGAKLPAPAATPAPGSSPSLPDGQLRIDVSVRGLSDLQQRSAYQVRLKGPDGKLLAPTRFSFVNDWKAGADGKQAGTLVYYFEPLKAGLNANAKVDLLIRNEQGSCAYDFILDLSKFS